MSKAADVELHKPVGEDGKGDYTADTKGCFDVIATAAPLVLEQVAQAPLRAGAFNVADFGTADGGTSLGLLTQVVEAVRKREAGKEVVLRYEDQLVNEWKSVFNHAVGNIRVKDAHGKTIPCPYDLGGVFVEGCGVGFHAQCYPSNSIDLGVCFTAMHWLSHGPGSLRGQPTMHSSRTNPRPAAEKAQAAKDWESVLRARHAELTVGGRLVIVNFCTSKDGYFLGQTDKGASMWDTFQGAMDKLKADGLISEEERLGVSFPNYYRTSEEHIAGVEAVQGLKLISCEEKVVRCPYRELHAAGKSGKTDAEYGKWYVPTTRTWSNSTFRSAFRADRPEAEKDELVSKFWANCEAIASADPSKHGMDYAHCYIVIEKTA